MKKKVFNFIRFGVVFTILSSCMTLNNDDKYAEKTYRFFITPAFTSVWEMHQEKFQECIHEYIEGNRITYQVAYAPHLKLTQEDILLSFYKLPINNAKSFQIGSGKIKFIANASNPQGFLTIEDLRDILEGKKTNWQALSIPIEQKQNYSAEEIQLYLYPSFDEITMALKDGLEMQYPISGASILLTNQAEIINAVSNDKRGLGVVIETNGTQPGVNPIEIQGQADKWTLPIIVHLPNNSDDRLIHLVGCFQKVLTT